MPGTYSQAPRIFFENFEEDQKVIESVQGDVEVYQKILTNSLRYFQNQVDEEIDPKIAAYDPEVGFLEIYENLSDHNI